MRLLQDVQEQSQSCAVVPMAPRVRLALALVELGIEGAEVKAAYHFVIHGAARTKKNSNRIVYGKGRPFILASTAYMRYHRIAVPQLKIIAGHFGNMPLTSPVNCAAVFFRKTAVGDLVGYMQGLADLLQDGGILTDDKLIVSWNNTRLDKDAVKPRVEVLLTSIA